MNHEETMGRLPGFVEGRLPEAELAVVLRHLDGCDECRALAEGYRVIARALRSEAASGGSEHPSSEALVAFATELTTIDPAERLQVARHLDACAACAADVDATRAAERMVEAQRGGETSASRTFARVRRFGWLAAAAVAGAALLGYPAYRAILGASAPETAIERAWDGALRLPVVSSTLRGGAAAVPTVEAPAGQPFVAFALSLSPDTDLPERTSLALALVAASGARVWRQEIDSGRLAALSGPSGAVLIVVPASVVPPGSYVLRLSRSGAPGDALLVEAPFRVVR